MKGKVIYLAGGFKSGWQDKVIAFLPNSDIRDPREHMLTNTFAYTQWDLNAIKESDVIIGFMEDSNPGGYALSLELGYAKALGKYIYFINELHDEGRKRYFEMVREIADKYFDSLEEFFEILKN